MKRALATLALTAASLWGQTQTVPQPSTVGPPSNLTQTTAREWVDLSKITFLRFSCYTGSVAYGGSLAVGGVNVVMTPDMEAFLRKWFGINRNFDCTNPVDDGVSTINQ
jgi:hypothetical protein